MNLRTVLMIAKTDWKMMRMRRMIPKTRATARRRKRTKTPTPRKTVTM